MPASYNHGMSMRAPTLRAFPFGVLLLVVLWGSLMVRARAEDWYQPAPADFQTIYDRDDSNRRCEPWGGPDGYWAWVRTFYGGYSKHVFGLCVFHQAGWTANGRQMEARLASDEARTRLRDALNRLGREIAGEWAKDDAHSRIGSRDLKRWGEVLRQAAQQDDGTGQILLATLSHVQAEVNLRLSSPH